MGNALHAIASNFLYVITTVVTLGCNCYTYSQSVSGYILDIDNTPVASATITLHPKKTSIISDSSGFFTISRSEEDDITAFLEVSHVAFITKRIDLVSRNRSELLTIILDKKINDLEEVVVLQPMGFENVTNNSQSVITINKDFISKSNLSTFAEALKALPGLNTMNLGVGIAKPMIRGMGFNRILVNNRGIKQEGQQWGADHGLEIDPFDIENVEIIKGPASLLFGSDGMGGVINIKNNEPLIENGNLLTLQSVYQTNNRAISNSLEWKGRQNKWFFGTRVTYQDYGDYTIPTNQFTYAGFNLPVFNNRLKNTAGNELHLGVSLGYQNENFKTSLKYTSFTQKAGIFTGAIGLPRAYNLEHNGDFRNIDFPRQENQHHMLTSNTSIDFEAQKLEINLGYQHNVREELSFPGAHGIAADLVSSNLALGLYLDTYTANIKYDIYPNANHTIVFGSQSQYMHNTKDGFEYLLPQFDSYQLGFYHYQLFRVSERWTMNGGIRYDYGMHDIQRHEQPEYDRETLRPTGRFIERTPEFDRNFENVSGAVGITHKLNKKHHLKLNFGNSFRFPTAIELSSNGVHHGNFRHEIGDQNLAIENGYQIDATYLHRSENTYFELSAFYGIYDNYIYLAPTGNFSFLASGGTMWQYQQNDAIFNGFELAASHQFPFHIKTDVVIDFVQNINRDTRLPLPLTPAPSVLASIEWNQFFKNSKYLDEEYLFISGRYNFEQDQIDRNESITPDSFIVDLGLGFHIPLQSNAIHCKLSATNIFNTRYFNHISRYRLINLPEPGRNFVFSAQIPIGF
ncbi:TonB-dependent receptor [Aquimarina sp. U1-2]|uniref:TonB-dependent receptor n=1 Tax=Aquimarina sp. U1-2 TaxID=2823141 RepID=UPI001AECDAD5|nr:TonB-dependent receptor [Aquimarina sp. U1-2]MBP2832930.1 TonB-dependent receptor [Aquimarina sp. U1-2]